MFTTPQLLLLLLLPGALVCYDYLATSRFFSAAPLADANLYGFMTLRYKLQRDERGRQSASQVDGRLDRIFLGSYAFKTF